MKGTTWSLVVEDLGHHICFPPPPHAQTYVIFHRFKKTLLELTSTMRNPVLGFDFNSYFKQHIYQKT